MTKGQKVWTGSLLAMTLTVLTAKGMSFIKPSDVSPLQTVLLEKGEMAFTIPATGVVEPAFTVEIKSRASGEAIRVHVEEGNPVKKGDVLVEIDPEIERMNVRRAEADLAVSEAKIKKAKIVLEGARVRRSKMDRLHEQGFLAGQDKEDADREVNLKEADLAMAQAEKARIYEELLEAKARLSHTRILSPITGTVLSLYLQPGQIVTSGTSGLSQGGLIAVLGDLSKLQIRAEVDETDAGKIAVGQEAKVSFDADPGRSFPARVKWVAPGAWTQNDLAVVKVLFVLDDLQGDVVLRPGLSANVEIVTRRLSDTLLLPREAVRLEGGKWGVSVVQGESVSFHEVTVGESDGTSMQIFTDLPAGTRVVVGGETDQGTPSKGRPGRAMP